MVMEPIGYTIKKKSKNSIIYVIKNIGRQKWMMMLNLKKIMKYHFIIMIRIIIFIIRTINTKITENMQCGFKVTV